MIIHAELLCTHTLFSPLYVESACRYHANGSGEPWDRIFVCILEKDAIDTAGLAVNKSIYATDSGADWRSLRTEGSGC